MQQLHSDLWIADTPLRFLGLEVGARMTVVRLPGPKLLLHSPIAATADRARKDTEGSSGALSETWCRRWDSNPHGLLHTILSRARIPISPLRLVKQKDSNNESPVSLYLFFFNCQCRVI